MADFKYGDKNIFYEEVGSGFPLILLHGNTLSSKMFTQIIDLYKKDFKVILIDFLGHGNSDRLEQFPIDFWYDQAMQVVQLITLNDYGKVNLIGTSGGALTALNVALEHEELVNKVIADSLEGETPLNAWTSTISEERNKSKTREFVCMLWEYCHGEDWESVVDNDTEVIIRHDRFIKNFFHKDLTQLKVPVMMSVSLKDDEYAAIMDIEEVYQSMLRKIPDGKLHLFPEGAHPSMLTNAKEFASVAKEFLKNK
ncbi:alpha/beta fold hydrolase [Robinsoniella peoriensis]|uniref:alpha/beta fold hydrolase n=1 Tax=Robinsoniella peoriensis TaxID=180332 RepID=UPI00085BFD08|nr:alpha/beta hydrolase [Robinsoniella peoriensis]